MNERWQSQRVTPEQLWSCKIYIHTHIQAYRNYSGYAFVRVLLLLESARRRRHVKCTYVCMFVCKYLPTHTHTYIWFSACLCMRAVAGRPKQHKLRDEPQQGSCHRPSTTTKKTKPDEIYNPAHPTVKYPTPS